MTIKIAHVGSYFEKENDIVKQMLRSLETFSELNVLEHDLRIYSKTWFIRYRRGPHGTLIIRRYFFNQIIKSKPDLMILNAGKQILTNKQFDKLNRAGIKSLAVGLSDPDLMAIGLQIAKNCNYYFTNSSTALSYYHNNGQENCYLLKFATESIGSPPTNKEKLFDVVVVGGMRTDRIPIVNTLTDAGFSVGCFGRSWSADLVPRATISESVRGADYVNAIRSGSIYLSFAGTVAGYENIKIGLLDAAAQGACVITRDFVDVANFFEKESEILTYVEGKDIVKLISETLDSSNKVLSLGSRAQQRVLRDHLWPHRWVLVFKILGISLGKDGTCDDK